MPYTVPYSNSAKKMVSLGTHIVDFQDSRAVFIFKYNLNFLRLVVTISCYKNNVTVYTFNLSLLP